MCAGYGEVLPFMHYHSLDWKLFKLVKFRMTENLSSMSTENNWQLLTWIREGGKKNWYFYEYFLTPTHLPFLGNISKKYDFLTPSLIAQCSQCISWGLMIGVPVYLSQSSYFYFYDSLTSAPRNKSLSIKKKTTDLIWSSKWSMIFRSQYIYIKNIL